LAPALQEVPHRYLESTEGSFSAAWTGTINGAGAFKFRVTVRDSDPIGRPDRFAIRILPNGSADFGGTHLWKGDNDLAGSNGAGQHSDPSVGDDRMIRTGEQDRGAWYSTFRLEEEGPP